jgi:hypothetical protein
MQAVEPAAAHVAMRLHHQAGSSCSGEVAASVDRHGGLLAGSGD